MKHKVSAWEDMVKAGIALSDIPKGSQEFEIMRQAAENGNASAQHSMGMWYQEIAKDLDTAKIWYNKAKENEHPSAAQALENLKDEVHHGK